MNRRWRHAAVALAAAGMSGLLTGCTAASSFGVASGRPWAATSPFNTPIPVSPVLDPNSGTIASYLSGGTNAQIASLYDYGWPVFNAYASTPKVTVTSTAGWGPDPFAGQAVPMPAGAGPNPGSDGHLAVIDWSTNRVYEFWQLKQGDATHWTTSWGQIVPDVITGMGNETLTGGSSTGSGISALGGLTRAYEMRQGHIDHALQFASDAVTPGPFRWPAVKTDGSNMSGQPVTATIPEGARIQLDPSVNLAAISGITAGELTVGRALQKYGAYCIDQGGARMGFGFENPAGDAAGDPYPGVGFAWDYYQMGHIPWNRIRVLRSWNGS